MEIFKDEPSNTMPLTHMWTVQPENVDRPFLLSISVPQGDAPEGGWAGVIGTDGNNCAGALNQAVTYPAMGGEIPPAVVVSIGYPLDWPMPAMVARNQDLTPSVWPEWDASYGHILNMDCPPSGEAANFLTFINEELKPEIEKRFDVDPSEWTLAGHSLGGLFSTYALLTEPTRFKRYLAVGSSYWWRGGELFETAEKFACEAGSLNIKIYLAAGDKESRAAFAKSWKPLLEQEEWREYIEIMNGLPEIVGDTERMAKILGMRAGVTVKSQTLFNETHGTAVLPAFSQGITWLQGGKE
jgi:predicted alpha/beta superfamily hydrolase